MDSHTTRFMTFKGADGGVNVLLVRSPKHPKPGISTADIKAAKALMRNRKD